MPELRHDDHRRHLAEGGRLFGLTTGEEQAWCRWFGAEAFTGAGAIVELGTWLGSLTASYCEGLAANPISAGRAGPLAYAYDLFRWEPWCEEEARGSEHAGRIPLGSSYLDYFRALHEPHLPRLEVRAADLAACCWDDGPIELLLNDAAKTLDIARNVFARFVPALLPGVGLVAHQDYLWSTDSFLCVPMYLRRESFRFEYTVPNSCMVVFRCIEAPPTAPLRLPSRLSEMDPALIEAAFDWSRQAVEAVPPEMIDLGRAVTLWQGDFREHAKRVVRDGDLGRKRGSPVYDFQLDALHLWGYGDLFSER